MYFILILALIFLLYYLLKPLLYRWLQKVAQDNLRRMTGINPDEAQCRRQADKKSQSGKVQEKVNLDELAKRKFDKENSNDYAEFEELPK